jgi:hypothetical protein
MSDSLLSASPVPRGSSAPSGSDFEADRQVKLAKRNFRRSHGKSVSNTEDDDLEDERELLEEVASETQRRLGHSPPPLTAKEKGKGRALVSDDEGDQSDGRQPTPTSGSRHDLEEEEEEEEEEPTHGRKYGPLSKAALLEAVELGNRTREDAERIAKKYGKAPRTVMIAAGLGIQNAREPNFCNQYKVWYAHHHPKPDGSKLFILIVLVSCGLITVSCF